MARLFFNWVIGAGSAEEKQKLSAAIVVGSLIGCMILFIINIVEVAKNKMRAKEAMEREKAERKRQAREEEKAFIQRHKHAQTDYFNQMMSLKNESVSLFECLPKELAFAENHLDQAEVDFNDSAYVPFWESIEKAVTALGTFDEGVNQISKLSHRYNELLQKYENVPPEFPLVPNFITKLDVQATVVNRLQSIVRKSQCDFQFATIYMQFKTNQILVAGFTNLGQAIDQMSFQITDSIDGLGSSVRDLCSSIYEMGSRFNGTMDSINARVGDIADTSRYQHAQQMEMSFKEATRTKKALEILDNIQRGRKPLL